MHLGRGLLLLLDHGSRQHRNVGARLVIDSPQQATPHAPFQTKYLETQKNVTSVSTEDSGQCLDVSRLS